MYLDITTKSRPYKFRFLSLSDFVEFSEALRHIEAADDGQPLVASTEAYLQFLIEYKTRLLNSAHSPSNPIKVDSLPTAKKESLPVAISKDKVNTTKTEQPKQASISSHVIKSSEKQEEQVQDT